MQITQEIRDQLLNARTAADVAVIYHENGVDLSLDKVQQIYDEIVNYNKAEGEELSLDELETVSGGGEKDRNWLTDGCYATVEGTSWCARNDLCEWLWTTYDKQPVKYQCPTCKVWLHEIYDDSTILGCHVCCRMFTYWDFD